MAETESKITTWCVKCQRTRMLVDTSNAIYRGRAAAQGRCPVCRTLVRKKTTKEV